MQNFFLIVTEVPAESYGNVSVFRRYYDDLSHAIRRPDLLAQELQSQGVIDQSIEVSI